MVKDSWNQAVSVGVVVKDSWNQAVSVGGGSQGLLEPGCVCRGGGQGLLEPVCRDDGTRSRSKISARPASNHQPFTYVWYLDNFRHLVYPCSDVTNDRVLLDHKVAVH